MSFLARLTVNADTAAKLAALDKSQATIEFTMDGIILTANHNFLAAMGYTLDDIKGKHHSLFVDPAYKASDEYRKFWADLNRGSYQAAQYKRLGKNNKEIWIEASYNPILDRHGKPCKVMKFATDITQQKMRDADYQGQVNAISKSQAVIEFAMDGTILNANSHFLKAMGYTLDEIKGKHHSIFVDAAYKASEEYRQFWAKLNRGEYQSGQRKRFGKNNKEVWIETSYNPIMDMNGKLFKVVKYATDITQTKTGVLNLSSNVKDLSAMMTTLATDLQSSAQNIALASEQTMEKSAAVAAASEELTSAVSEISRQLTESNKVVNSAVIEAKNSEQKVSSLISAAEKIGTVSSVVAQIAGQTNLLALNATIEAARAGEAGKGFAVVASEVKSLANQTAKATEEIGQQVSGIQSSSQETATGIREISAVISRVSQISVSISGAVEEQSAATREVAENIGAVKTAAEQTNTSSAALLAMSEKLAQQALQLDKEVTAFTASI